MNKAIIYTTGGCLYCQKAKKLLKMLNVEYQEFDVTNSFNQMQQELAKSFNQNDISTVPQIILNDKYIGGYDDLEFGYKNSTLNLNAQ